MCIVCINFVSGRGLFSEFLGYVIQNHVYLKEFPRLFEGISRMPRIDFHILNEVDIFFKKKDFLMQ